MSTGQLECYPEVMLPCETSCFVCKRDPKGYIKPILFEGAVEFLGSKRIQDALPLEITYASCDDILDLLYMDRDWLIRVFGMYTVRKYNVASFFFQLFATKILSFEWHGAKGVSCVLSRDKNDNYLYLDVKQWEGFEFRNKKQGNLRNAISFKECLQEQVSKEPEMVITLNN